MNLMANSSVLAKIVKSIRTFGVVQIEKEVVQIDKEGKKTTKIISNKKKLEIVGGLWQPLYRILLII